MLGISNFHSFQTIKARAFRFEEHNINKIPYMYIVTTYMALKINKAAIMLVKYHLILINEQLPSYKIQCFY